MSFILDALRKSESSRLRDDHPAIFTARVSPPRSGMPRWIPVLIVLLILNLLIVGAVLWKDRSATNSALQPAASQQAASQQPASQTAVSLSATAPISPVSPQASPPIAIPSMNSSSPAPAAPRASVPTVIPPRASASVSAPAQPELRTTRDDLLARGASIPPVELNMHVYDPNPAARFVLLNGQRLREGEASREGLAIERITPSGVILRFGSSSFAVNLQ